MSNRRREDEREKRFRITVLMLGLACLIQGLVSLRMSCASANRQSRQRDAERSRFDRIVREQGGGAPGRAGVGTP